MELISFIVPVFNTEQYLRECIDSLLSQTWSNTEIILIDDGSTDNSLKILEEYAQKYPNIFVLHKENGGVSSARNLGLKHAHGEYIFFVDSDDWVEPFFAEYYMQCGNIPYVAGGYTEYPNTNFKMRSTRCCISIDDYTGNLLEFFPKIPSVHVTHNRYSASVIRKNNLSFDENSHIGEDIRFNTEFFRCIDKLATIDRCDYFYRMRSDSAIHSFFQNRQNEERSECQLRETLLRVSPDFDFIKYIHWHIALEHYWLYSKSKNPNQANAKKGLRTTIHDKYFRKCIPYILKNGTKDMKTEAFCLLMGSYRFYKFSWSIILQLRKLLKTKININ